MKVGLCVFVCDKEKETTVFLNGDRSCLSERWFNEVCVLMHVYFVYRLVFVMQLNYCGQSIACQHCALFIKNQLLQKVVYECTHKYGQVPSHTVHQLAIQSDVSPSVSHFDVSPFIS